MVTITPHTNIQVGLSHQGVTAVRRILIRRDGKLIPTKHLILTFNKPTLPSSVVVGYLCCPVHHTFQTFCVALNISSLDTRKHHAEEKKACAQCGIEDHESTECKSTPCCVNSKDDHPAYSQKCPAWQREKEIQRVITVNIIPYLEAYHMVTPNAPVQQKTFAAVLKSTKTCGVQKDISVSPNESLTFHAKCY
ncbi:uncharacterized protein LOC111614267 [Centruroides sculpturatus]|uniref:uncharacterized protein LOC111614267 n=1 Tax=Centruroides sculpturatus TaxID=218467 RepID=UPI000C6ED1B3|nr:uncharacterized protein LOC111614267 [Centruroides sculpturatus]